MTAMAISLPFFLTVLSPSHLLLFLLLLLRLSGSCSVDTPFWQLFIDGSLWKLARIVAWQIPNPNPNPNLNLNPNLDLNPT